MRKIGPIVCGAMLLATAALADIISTVGLAIVPAPSLVTGNFIINSGGALPPQIIFAEQQGFTLTSPLVTDTGTIPVGTIVDSYFFAVNAPLSNETITNTSATFNAPILGITYQENLAGVPSANFAVSDFLGAPGTIYQESNPGCIFCAFEIAGQGGQPFNPDTALYANNLVSLAIFHNDYSEPGDFARIVTEHSVSVPAPILGAGIPGLLAGALALFALVRRRRS